jgi:NTP pyrophosphatase (non-canonical NTP hydrolase)
MTQSNRLKALAAELRQFAVERDWEQFHSPKNLVMALTVEAAELQELFQWLSTDESSELTAQQIERVGEEMADVLIYLVRLADQLNIDLLDAAEEKIEVNRNKYPADVVRGRANKYTEY